MKIAIGFQLKDNSWGGGNQFVEALVNTLKKRGDEIIFNLKDNDIDIILFFDPRFYNEGITFGAHDILNYLFFINKKAIVIHRINECDERKNTWHMNKLLKFSNYCSDHTILISTWLSSLDIYQKDIPFSIIFNGADSKVFNPSLNTSWDKKGIFKIVTHHWSPNYMKGFDVYIKLDKLLDKKEWRDICEFTYIGNLPDGFKFRNARHIKPLNGDKLAYELSKNHLYISASINEPAGMHHIEGILSGLPILYRRSGALPEYCLGFGIEFEGDNFIPALYKMFNEYDNYKSKIANYQNNADKMCRNYLLLFDRLLKERRLIVKRRNLLRSPFVLFVNFLLAFLSIKSYIKKIVYSLRKIFKC